MTTSSDRPLAIDDRALLLSGARDRVCDLECFTLALANASDGLAEANVTSYADVGALFSRSLFHVADELEEIETLLYKLMRPVVPQGADGPDAAEPSDA